jgi:hypothetical protein
MALSARFCTTLGPVCSSSFRALLSESKNVISARSTEAHISYLATKIAGIIYKCKFYLPKRSLLQLYYHINDVIMTNQIKLLLCIYCIYVYVWPLGHIEHSTG